MVPRLRSHEGSRERGDGTTLKGERTFARRTLPRLHSGMPSDPRIDADQRDLAAAGYRQELDRTLGRFSSFAAGFSYISILTGMFQNFHLGFKEGGPAFFWTWPAMFVGQFAVALCFAELAAHYPLCGGVYQWSRHVGSRAVGWLAGWVYLASLVVTLAAVALALQTTLPQISPAFQVIGEVSDGSQAVHQARLLQPDMILLDIGLPTLNGIEAARQIRKVSPASKILFVTENRSADIVGEALNTGATGYVVKSDAARELLSAIKAVLESKRFVSDSLAGYGLNDPPDPGACGCVDLRHEVGFYSEDRYLLDHVTRFVATALKAGNAAIVAATATHREKLLLELQANSFDMVSAIEEGRYIALDATDTLSMFMVNGMPDPVRFLELLGDLIVTASGAAKAANPRVSVFGECVHLLWAQDNPEAAVQMEKLGNKLTQIHAIDILCGYSLSNEVPMNDEIFQQICAEHSAIHSF